MTQSHAEYYETDEIKRQFAKDTWQKNAILNLSQPCALTPAPFHALGVLWDCKKAIYAFPSMRPLLPRP